ncbi:anti-sigma regulatory factor [Mycobacterium intermedium]|uniref:Anti-sigma regulatory factor n=1 Tax=Mycobacterium intermedium TaxID=28445 RepID=A0A1E3SKP2_MYCIE|nr:ATP-binding protein [Mycobacterium intermedium]MCV6963011.1 ATP-binding protein [Mycobacterium intermedium]ODR02707.1 anti-sigma regulatory factor [Mycobacterium intermedium]OPE47275.1 anti-sigma regulatory factor [Mycobacterium intermedium]ORB10378.1 anti-sigma regulatory factor [Mycobacterium intermedium]
MTSNIDDRFRFVRRRIAADPHSASRTRVEFRRWLDRHFTLGAERFSDLLLAVSEALSNAAEFAYAGSTQRGTMDVSANYDVDSDTLAVTVSDHGRWRQTVPAQATATCDYQVRGRGIPLMRALADETTIDPTPHGTNVKLTWNHFTRPRV